MLHRDMFQVCYLPTPRWKRGAPWEGSKGPYRAEMCTWIIFLWIEKWGGFNEWWLVLSRVNLLAAGEIAYYGHIIMISRSTIPRLGSSEWYKYLVYRGVGWTWFKLESCLWSVVSYVEASNTWGPRARTCQISYHKSKLSLFWINAMVHKLKWKKRPRGQRHFQMS